MLFGPRTDTAVRSLTDPVKDLLHARSPFHEPEHWAVQLQGCNEDNLHLPIAGVGPTQLDHVSLTGLQTFFQSRMPSPLTHRPLHPLLHKMATKRTRQSATGHAYVVGRYGDHDWNQDCPGLSVPLVAMAALMFLWGDVLDRHRQHQDMALVPLLTPYGGGGFDPPPLWEVHGRSAFNGACKAVWGQAEWAIVLLLP